MIVLALETTGATCGVALASCTPSGMQLIALHEVFGNNIHDARLAGLTQSVLSDGNCTLDDVDLVAVSAGPGSFTGTRIGVSFAKGLTMWGRPQLMLVDTSLALAGAADEVARAIGARGITVIIPSHQDMVYADHFTLDDDPNPRYQRATQIGPTVQKISTIDARLLDATNVVCGPGAARCHPSPISGLTRLSARFIAREACRQPLHHDPLTAEPLYRQEFVGRHSIT